MITATHATADFTRLVAGPEGTDTVIYRNVMTWTIFLETEFDYVPQNGPV